MNHHAYILVIGFTSGKRKNPVIGIKLEGIERIDHVLVLKNITELYKGFGLGKAGSDIVIGGRLLVGNACLVPSKYLPYHILVMSLDVDIVIGLVVIPFGLGIKILESAEHIVTSGVTVKDGIVILGHILNVVTVINEYPSVYILFAVKVMIKIILVVAGINDGEVYGKT
jgi:hypothetical protein